MIQGVDSAVSKTPEAALTAPAEVALRRSAWPARLDVLQSASGLMLALFMWLHMLFVSSILLGSDAMWTVARAFEGYFVFGRRLPWLVSLVVAAVIVLFATHAAMALRKFPASYAAHRTFRAHMARMRHEDTTLWYWQVVTGFALFFLASLHLGTMLTRPDRIGPYESADRVWSDRMWPVYLALLFIVELHAGVGLYRLALKWGWGVGPDANAGRRRLRMLKWSMTAFFVALGLATLAAYMRIGIEHAGRYGERYVPAAIAKPGPDLSRKHEDRL
jgi:succinate dehydrogenase subunit C